ncbi:MAG TPA: ATP-binding cassette domain-containing protein [Candidatus Polarisedimenticolaceae bacterium]|nr:ATP-binding cassette domain-containing protein [Candidatus Polarisedimenticolaceae bacterium]
MNAAIRLEAATRRYAAFQLEPTSLAVAAGSWTVVTGRSGSGKTTLLNLMATLDRADGGRVFVLDHEVAAQSEAALSRLRRQRLGIVYQRFHFIDHLPVWQNVSCRWVPDGMSAAGRRERARKVLAELGLEALVDRRPRELSGGEQQRVALARALAPEPALLIADEPTSHLDAATGAMLAERLRRLHAGGATLVIASHDPALIEAADMRHTIDRGRIV